MTGFSGAAVRGGDSGAQLAVALGGARQVLYWVRRYPTFIVDGQKVVGWDEGTLVSRIEACLGAEAVR